MHVRGAGLIGVTAAYGMYLAAREAAGQNDFDEFIRIAAGKISDTRPTAVNLAWAVEQMTNAMKKGRDTEEKTKIALQTANEILEHDIACCRKIGENGLKIIKKISLRKKRGVVNILTHCNAGWLAFGDYGTATAPIYEAFDKGIKLHVWVDETRPLNQGSRLTAWELREHGVPYSVIADNTGGYLMQTGQVDMVITGADRVTRTGDVANKIGTYLKALAAHDNNIPFYVALPSSTIDWKIRDGLSEIPVEKRGGEEVNYMEGLCDGEIKRILVSPAESNAVNYAFDITPAKFVTGFITERGICRANEKNLLELFPEFV